MTLIICNLLQKKYNTISFRSPINDLITVNIEGAVDFPGTYTMSSDSVVQDLYDLIGNFKTEAFLEGIIFTRKNIRDRQLESLERSKEDLNRALFSMQQKGDLNSDINIYTALAETIMPANLGRLAGNFIPQSQTANITTLLDGDTLFVPVNPNVINVLGEVLNPIAFEHKKNMSISSAIASAGGFRDYADKRKVYVIKSNGLIEMSSRNVFARNIKLEPGDTIVVPRKIDIAPGLQSLLPVTQVLSDLAFSAAAIDNLQNN